MTNEWTLQSLIDHEKIRQLMYRYSRGADRHDEAILRSVYTPDAVDNHGPFRGRAADFVQLMMNPTGSGYAVGQHHIGNILIELDGGTARAESVFVCYLFSDTEVGRVADVLGGRYLDVLESTAGEWLISHRTVALDWNERRVLTDSIPGPETFVQGRRNADDPSYVLFGGGVIVG